MIMEELQKLKMTQKHRIAYFFLSKELNYISILSHIRLNKNIE